MFAAIAVKQRVIINLFVNLMNTKICTYYSICISWNTNGDTHTLLAIEKLSLSFVCQGLEDAYNLFLHWVSIFFFWIVKHTWYIEHTNTLLFVLQLFFSETAICIIFLVAYRVFQFLLSIFLLLVSILSCSKDFSLQNIRRLFPHIDSSSCFMELLTFKYLYISYFNYKSNVLM